MTENNAIIRLRPHHLIDIFKHSGNGLDLSKPHPYGHAQHIIAEKILNNPDTEIEFICENDDICKPCRHRGADNLCSDVLSRFSPPVSKQQYNDELDKSVFEMLEIVSGERMSARVFLELLLSRISEIVPLATHPGQDAEYTESGLLNAVKIWE